MDLGQEEPKWCDFSVRRGYLWEPRAQTVALFPSTYAAAASAPARSLQGANPCCMPPRSFEQLELPEVEEIVIQDAELRQMILELARRSAGGANKGGRYNKHDTARLRFIRDKALMGLRLGILVRPGAGLENDSAASAGRAEAKRRRRLVGNGSVGGAARQRSTLSKARANQRARANDAAQLRVAQPEAIH